MKNIIAAILLSTVSIFGASVKLAWDPSITPGVQYNIYASTNPDNLFLNPRGVGTNLNFSFVGSLPPGVWIFSVTATLDGVESDPTSITNRVSVPPSNLRVVIPQK